MINAIAIPIANNAHNKPNAFPILLYKAYKTTLCMIVTNHKRSLYLIAKKLSPFILVVATSIAVLLLQSKHILNSFLKNSGRVWFIYINQD
jgi:hypothetical protein